MNNPEQAKQQEANSPDSRDMTIERLLRQRARERAAPLRWNIYSALLSYLVLAAVIIMSLEDVDVIITGLTAVLGLGLVWLNSWLRIRKLERTFYQEEAENYAKLAPAESPEESTQAAADSLVDSVEPPLTSREAAVLARSVQSPLTSREAAVLEQMAEGKSSKQIARALEISPQTVKNHISHIFSKLDVTDRTSAVLVALRHGWIKDGHEKSCAGRAR
jgi:DNA-binding NarL/FixJ family response regulator